MPILLHVSSRLASTTPTAPIEGLRVVDDAGATVTDLTSNTTAEGEISHSNMLDPSLLHQTFHYEQDSDPGAVGAGLWWLDTTVPEAADPSGFVPSSIFDIGVFEADDIAGADGDPVATWTKQSGTISEAAAQATGANKPLLKTGANGLNGHNVILFDGVNDSLSFGDTASLDFGTNPFSIFVVFRQPATGNSRIFLKDNDAGADNGFYLFGDNDSNSIYYYNGTSSLFIGTRDSDYHLIGVSRTGTGTGELTTYLDGASITVGREQRTLSNSKSATIGISADGTSPLAGNIAAIYIASAVPSDTDLNIFSAYIEETYGIAVSPVQPVGLALSYRNDANDAWITL